MFLSIAFADVPPPSKAPIPVVRQRPALEETDFAKLFREPSDTPWRLEGGGFDLSHHWEAQIVAHLDGPRETWPKAVVKVTDLCEYTACAKGSGDRWLTGVIGPADREVHGWPARPFPFGKSPALAFVVNDRCEVTISALELLTKPEELTAAMSVFDWKAFDVICTRR